MKIIGINISFKHKSNYQGKHGFP